MHIGTKNEKRQTKNGGKTAERRSAVFRFSFFVFPCLRLLTGCGVPSFLITPVQNTSSLHEVQVEKGKRGRDKIAMIEVEGMLMNAKSGGVLPTTEKPPS